MAGRPMDRAAGNACQPLRASSRVTQERGPSQTRCNCGRFESLLELCLNQRTVIQCDVFVFFWHAAFSHERMLHLELERALGSNETYAFIFKLESATWHWQLSQ